jgi:hypothetical protein
MAVTSRAGVEQIGIFKYEVFPDGLGLKMVYVHSLAHVVPDLSFETIDATK